MERLDGRDELYPVYVQIFEARAVAGVTFEECADALNISASSIKRKWKIAAAWLKERDTCEEHHPALFIRLCANP